MTSAPPLARRTLQDRAARQKGLSRVQDDKNVSAHDFASYPSAADTLRLRAGAICSFFKPSVIKMYDKGQLTTVEHAAAQSSFTKKAANG